MQSTTANYNASIEMHYKANYGQRCPRVIFAGPTCGKSELARRMREVSNVEVVDLDDLVARTLNPLILIGDEYHSWQNRVLPLPLWTELENRAYPIVRHAIGWALEAGNRYVLTSFLGYKLLPVEVRALGFFRTNEAALISLRHVGGKDKEITHSDAEAWVAAWRQARSSFRQWYELGAYEFLTDFIVP